MHLFITDFLELVSGVSILQLGYEHALDYNIL